MLELDLILIQAKTFPIDENEYYTQKIKALEYFLRKFKDNKNTILLVAPEYYLSSNPLSNKETNKLLSNLENIFKEYKGIFIPSSFLQATTKFLILHRLKNTTPIFIDGKLKKIHNKMFCTLVECVALKDLKHRNVEYEPGKSPCVIEYKGMRIGIEICAEHSDGVLKRKFDNNFDIQIISACGVKVNYFNIVVNKGYVIYTDGYLKNCGVFQVSNDQISLLYPMKVIEYEEKCAYCYRIKIKFSSKSKQRLSIKI